MVKRRQYTGLLSGVEVSGKACNQGRDGRCWVLLPGRTGEARPEWEREGALT